MLIVETAGRLPALGQLDWNLSSLARKKRSAVWVITALLAPKQIHADLLFKIAHLPTHPGFGDIEPPSGGREEVLAASKISRLGVWCDAREVKPRSLSWPSSRCVG